MVKSTAYVNGIQLIMSGDMVISALKKRGTFEPDSLTIWNMLAERKGFMLDIGAYTGVYAISAAMRGSKVCAFEPNPTAAKRLYENANVNRVAGLVNIENRAAWNRHEILTLNLAHGNLTSAATLMAVRDHNFKVQAIPVDAYSFEDVTAIKIDAERAEIEVLEGALDTIERNLPVLLVEELDDDMNSRVDKTIGHLGYKAEKLSQNMTAWRV